MAQADPTTRDRTRQVVVVVSAVLAIVGAFAGSGVAFGTPINEAAGGALAADATLIAPGTGAFQIWGLIYLGLVVYAIWQLVPAQAHAERHRRVGYLVAVSLLLNAAWILSIQFDQLWLSVPVIAALVIVLGVTFARLVRSKPTGAVDAVVTDGTVGLYLGWVSVATAANVTAWLQAIGFDGFGIASVVWAVVVVAVACAVGVWVAIAGSGRIAPMLSLGWGLAWIAVARLTGEPSSAAVGVAAILAVVVVVGVTLVARLRPSVRRAPVAAR